MKSNFVDYVRLYLTSGNGGRGCVSWRREKHVPLGGPDGGDGGKGGSIWLVANPQLWTLLDLKYRKFIKAEHGQPGGGQRCNGRNGKDIILEVPVGTVAIDDLTGETIGELTEPGQRLLVVPGGQGGLGNWHFRTATNQTPEYAQTGIPGQERQVVLELKLLADVGLVGFPNAGKSTLLSVLTSAKPEIADYPFTTLQPNLGIVRYHDYQSFVMADIPGIIEGAAEGRGLGLTFLRHIERNAALLFLVPADTDDIRAQYHILLHELEKYTPELLDTPRMLGISKTDLIDAEIQEALQTELHDLNPVFFSAAAETNLDTLKDKLWQLLNPPDEW